MLEDGVGAQINLIQGKPSIKVYALQKTSEWLYDMGAGVTVISEQLYKKIKP